MITSQSGSYKHEDLGGSVTVFFTFGTDTLAENAELQANGNSALAMKQI